MARARYKPLGRQLILEELQHRSAHRGEPISDTAVTSTQLDLLLRAVQATDSLAGAIAEIGSYRGVTTASLARATTKQVYAIDPFIGYGGSSEDAAKFHENVRGHKVIHIREPSGTAARRLNVTLSLVFVDAVHDFSNAWHDFNVWSSKLCKGGLLAMHDVDDFAGVNAVCQRVMKLDQYQTWAYSPNLVIFRRIF
jgi:predicted O-methyltransferase YrrM